MVFAVIVFIFANIFGTIIHVLQYIGTYNSVYGIVFIFNLYRACMYAICAVYIRCRYPLSIFGSLMGSVHITIGITSLINIGISQVISSFEIDGLYIVIYILAGLVLLTLSFPIAVLLNVHKRAPFAPEIMSEEQYRRHSLV